MTSPASWRWGPPREMRLLISLPCERPYVHLWDEPFLKCVSDRNLGMHACDERCLDLAGRFFICGIFPDGFTVSLDKVRYALRFVGQLILDELDGLLLRTTGLAEVDRRGVVDHDGLPGQVFGKFFQVLPAQGLSPGAFRR